MSNDKIIARLFKLWAKIAMMVVDGTRDPIKVAEILQSILDQPIRSWREENDIIYFSVTSDGTTGEDWITRLENKGFYVDSYAKQVLRSPDFKPTSGVTTEVAVLKNMFFDNDRTTKKVCAEGALRKLGKPNAELACLIRLKVTDEDIEAMGLVRIVTMHEPINDSGGGPILLGASRSGDGRRFGAYSGWPSYKWLRGEGFAFAVLQPTQ